MRIGLRTKQGGTNALVLVIVVFVLTGLAIRQLRQSITAELVSKGHAIGISLAGAMEQSVGSGISTIQGSVDANKDISSVCYIYILDESGTVVAHTFTPSFPSGFDKAVAGGESIGDKLVTNPAVSFHGAACHAAPQGAAGIEAIDIAVPVTGGALGFVHVGMDKAAVASQVAFLRNTMVVSGSLVFVLAMFLSAILTLVFVANPIRELTRATREIVFKGDLSQQILIHSEDEIGDLAEMFRQMVERLRTIPVTLNASVTDLGGAVRGLTEFTHRQNEAAHRQASGLAEASATTQEIKQTSSLAASKAETVVQVAIKAEEFSNAGQGAVESSLAGLQEIRHQIEGIVEKIADLSERTLQVGEIIESVKDLADQSNVLALNAAIEAAKAGEFGRGFSVVAREIRSLADQSIQSTGRIREILSEIQAAIRATVGITEEGKRRMESSMDQIRASGENLRDMTAIVQESSQAARQIAASVNQQNAGIAQISVAISTLNGAMEEAIGGIRGTEAAVENLKSVSGRIAGIVESFRV